jgi:aminopeptidase N
VDVDGRRLNTFVQFLAEREWEKRYPSRRGEARWITGYMASRIQVPIMTNSEQILQFGNNAYAKPATALNVLRETVLGRELFDDAFQEYARRWAFKRPTPADFFRTMEDASGIDLDWFWRGWFYTTKHVDISIERVREYRVSTMDPDVEMPLAQEGASQGRTADRRAALQGAGPKNRTLPRAPRLLQSLRRARRHRTGPRGLPTHPEAPGAR